MGRGIRRRRTGIAVVCNLCYMRIPPVTVSTRQPDYNSLGYSLMTLCVYRCSEEARLDPIQPTIVMPAKPAKPTRAQLSQSVTPSPPPPPQDNTLLQLWHSYSSTTPAKLKLIDCFLAFLCLSGIGQFGYCLLITSFPFNAFLASFVPDPVQLS